MDDYQHHKPTTRPSTARAYRYAWRRYTDWCATEGREPWADPDGATFAGFVVAMTRAGLKATTLRQCRAAIVYRYATDPALYGLADPTKTDRAKAEMSRISERDLARRPAKALEMTPDMLEKVLEVSMLRRSGESREAAALRHLEAEATLRLMFDCLLRADDMARAEWTDLDARPDDNDNRTLYVRPGKTRDDGYAPVTPATWAALQRWRAASPDPTGRISTANSPQALGQRIRRLGQFAGIPITSHSARRGRATTAARDGATEYELMALGRWKSPAMANEYVKPLKANKVAARLYPNGHDTADTAEGDRAQNLADAFAETTPALMEWAALEAALQMAVQLGAARDHPAVAATRARILELWPEALADHPPPDCARGGCCGMVGFSISTGGRASTDRWCSEQCRRTVRNARRRAGRKQT